MTNLIVGTFPFGPGVDLGVDAPVIPLRPAPRVRPPQDDGRAIKDGTYDHWMRLALASEEDHRFKDAVKYYRAAMIRNPVDPVAPHNVGVVLHNHLGDVPGALEAYRRSIRLRDTAEARFAIGVALEDLGDEVGAIVSYRRTIALDPGHVDVRYNLAKLLEKRGNNHDEAREHALMYNALQSKEKP